MYPLDDMKYRLMVITHGDNATLAEALESFVEHVSPAPHSATLVYDGGEIPPNPKIAVQMDRVKAPWEEGHSWCYATSPSGHPQGYCRNTARAWELADEFGDHEFVFWLEGDFTFDRDVDLRFLAAVLQEVPDLAQMALYRNAVNSEEVEHGGYLNIPSRVDAYVPTLTPVSVFDEEADRIRDIECPWFSHNLYWTTTPSLFRRSLAKQFTWPTVDQCEGMFGAVLRETDPEVKFGVWGPGDQWVTHIGVRSGFGY